MCWILKKSSSDFGLFKDKQAIFKDVAVMFYINSFISFISFDAGKRMIYRVSLTSAGFSKFVLVTVIIILKSCLLVTGYCLK